MQCTICVTGYKSWRRPELGSWFIRAIVAVFAEHAHDQDVQSLFTFVSSVMYSRTNINFCVFDCTKVAFLSRHKIFFPPKVRAIHYPIQNRDNMLFHAK